MSTLIELSAYDIPWQVDEVRYYEVRNDDDEYKVVLNDDVNTMVTIANIDSFMTTFVDIALEAYMFKFTFQSDGEALADLTVKYEKVTSLKEV